MKVEVRAARPGDGTALHAMVRELCASHGTLASFKATPADYERDLFRADPVIGALLAMAGGKPAGCAFWHRSYSTNRGCEVMYLEDLSVLPEFRRKGVARALLRGLARLARTKGYPSMFWVMMEWNDAARSLYEGLGAEIESGTCFCRIAGLSLERLAS